MYITYKVPPRFRQMTFDEMLSEETNLSEFKYSNSSMTRTLVRSVLPSKLADLTDVPGLVEKFEKFCGKYAGLYDVPRGTLYDTWRIPKKEKGPRGETKYRTIRHPNSEELRNAHKDLQKILEDSMMACYHTRAYAYIRHRRTKDAIRVHQRWESKWFANFDFTDFFGSTTLEFLSRMVFMSYPFCMIPDEKKCIVRKALDLCFLNDGLPQGTTISPMLTNLMMIPFDHMVSNELHKHDGDRFVYTRYADDIHISCRVSFDVKRMENYLIEKLKVFQAPFTINKEKTGYGSINGKNFCLGYMLNKDNQITIGHERKKRCKAAVNNYILDKLSGNPWPLNDVQVLNGQLNYWRYDNEDGTYAVMLNFFKRKYGCDVEQWIKKDLSA